MGSIWAEFGLDYTKFQQGVQQVTKELVTLDGKYREAAARMEQTVNAAMEQLGASIYAASAKQQLLGESFDGNAAKARALEQALDQLLSAGVSPTNERVQELAQQLQSVRSRMEQAAEAAQQMNTQMGSVAERIKATAQEMSQLGSQMSIGLSLPLSALTGFAAKASADFESAMAKVWTITDQSKAQLESLASQIEQMSTSIPQSAQQLAAGLYDAIGSGITDVAEAMQVLEVAAKAGQAGATSTAVAMDALTSAINAYGMEASQAGELADMMFRAMDRGKLTFEEIAGNLGQVISTAAVAGVQFEEVAAAFATLTKGGVGAAEAATAINQAILTIIQPSEEAAEYAESLGIEFNAAALASKGLAGVMEDVYQATGGNIEAMATLFNNVRALKGALGLTRNEMADYNSDLEAMSTASGAAERAFEKQMQTSAAQAQLFKNEIANLGRAFGSELLPMLNDALERIKPLIQAFTELPDGAKQAAIAFAAVTAAIGPLMAAVGGLVNLLSGPAGWIVAVTAVGSAIYGLVSSVRDLEGQIDRQISSAREAINEAMSQADAYERQASALDDLIEEYEELEGKPDRSQEEHERLRQVIDEIVRLAPTAVTGFDDMGKALIGNAEAAKQYREQLWSLRNDQLQLAAMRVKYELPRHEETIRRYGAEFEQVSKDLVGVQEQYFKMRQVIFKLEQATTNAARDAILDAAFKAGVFSPSGAPPATQYAAIEKQYNTLYDRYSTLSAIIEKATAAVIELRKAEEELAEHQKLKPGESVSRVTPGPPPAPSTATPGSQAAAQTLSDWEAFGQKVKALSKDAYGALQKGWADIERGLASTDPAVRTWAEARRRALLKVITEALTQFEGDWTQAANAASIEVKSGFQSIRKQFEESAKSASKSAENQFAQYGAKVRELNRDVYGGLIDEWDAIAAALASDDPVARTWATTRANTLTKVINDAITETSGTTADQWAAAVAAAVKEIESGYESVRRKVREGVSDDDFVRGLVQDVERKAALEDWGYERTADAIQKILDAETMSAKLRADLEYKVASLKKNAADKAADDAAKAAEKAARDAEKAAKEATTQQEQYVRDRIEAVQREAALNSWSYGQIADALQEILDTEEMAARTQSDLAYEVAMNRKRAADKAAADEKKAADEAAKAAEQQAREAERRAREAEKAQDAHVKSRVEAIDRAAELEDATLAEIADAIQRVLDTEEMTAGLRYELSHRVAMARKRFAEEAAAAEEKASKDAAREAQRLAQEAERQRDQSVKDRVEAIQRQAYLEEWSYNQVADALQEVLDTAVMSAELQSDLAYEVAVNRKRAADKASADEKKAADEAAREAEKRAREAERLAQEEARARDARVRAAVTEIQRAAALEEWSYTRVAEAIQKVLDTETMSADLRSQLAHDVAMNLKRARDEATEAEKKASEEALRQAERQAKEAMRLQDQSVRHRVEQIQRQATLEEWSYEQIADAIQKVLDAEEMSADLREDLAFDVALSRKRAADTAAEVEKKAADEAAKAAEKQAREAEKAARDAELSQDEKVRALQKSVQREAQLHDWTYEQIADGLQEILDTEEMTADLRSDLAFEVAMNRKRAADKAAADEKKAADDAAKAAKQQAKEAERAAAEATRAQDDAVRERVTAITRAAYLEDWSFSQIADAIQELLDTEKMSAKLRSDLANDVAVNRKRAADKAVADEKKAAEDAARAAEQAAREAERAQEQRVRDRVTQIQRLAYLEDWSYEKVADALQAVIDTETMSARLKSDLANDVAVNKKKAAEKAAADEEKAAEKAAKAAEKAATEAAKAQEEKVRGLVLAAKREAELNEWTYGRIADAIQRVLDTEEMSAELRADLEYEVALNRKKAADKAAADAEKQAKEAAKAVEDEIRAQDARVKVRQQAVQRIAALEDWSSGQMAEALQAILDEEEMSAELRIALEHEVAMARKSAAQEVATGEEEAWALRQRLGLVTAQQVIQREAAVAEASQQNANARAGAVSRMYETVMALANEAKLDELKGIRETMRALQLKYEAMGEGWEFYALAAKMALEQIDGMIGDREKSWGKTLADSILRNLGAVGDVIVSFQRNAATYDSPVKAFMMTLAEMVMKSRQFAALVDALNPIIEELIDMFGQLIAPLVPIIDILVRILTPVIRAVAAVFAWVADVIVGIYNAVAKTINALLGWLGVHIPTIEADWRKDYGIDKDQGGKAGTQISEITGPTRDLLVELMRPLRVLDSLPVYAASVERAIYSMRDAFLVYAGGQAAANGAAEAVVNNYYSISTINIYSSGEEDFDQLMESLGRRADLALLGSGA